MTLRTLLDPIEASDVRGSLDVEIGRYRVRLPPGAPW